MNVEDNLSINVFNKPLRSALRYPFVAIYNFVLKIVFQLNALEVRKIKNFLTLILELENIELTNCIKELFNPFLINNI